MLKLNITLEMDEEQLREIFEGQDVKFSKAKAKKLQKAMDFNLDDVQIDLEERFVEIVEEWIESEFGE